MEIAPERIGTFKEMEHLHELPDSVLVEIAIFNAILP